MLYSWLPRLLIVVLTAICMDAHTFERANPSEVPLPDAKRMRSTISIHTEFTGDEKNLAKDTNRTSRLVWLAPELLNAIMHNNARVQRTFYQACRYLAMLVIDLNRPDVDGGTLIGHIRVRLSDSENAGKRSGREKIFSLGAQNYSLTESRFALRNICLTLDITQTYLTPDAVVVFQKILAENPAIYGFDCRDVNGERSHNYNEDILYERMTGGIFKNGLWSVDTSRFTQLRYLGVGRYISLCEKNSLFFLFYPHPSQLTNLEELHFAGDSPDIITANHYGWVARLPKLRKLSVSSDSNAEPGDMIVQMPFEGFSSLTYLRLARVCANQEFYQTLSSLRSLQTLKIAEDFPDTLLTTLPLLTNLTALKIMNCREIRELTRIPNLVHLTTGLNPDFGALASSSSIRILSIQFTGIEREETRREKMGNITALTQLETIIIRDPCMVMDFEHNIGQGKLIDPQFLNALPNLTNLIFDVDTKGSKLPILELPIYRRDLKPSISVTNRKGKVTFADKNCN